MTACNTDRHLTQPYEWAEPVPLKTSLQRAREVFATLLNLLVFAFESVPLWWETLVAQFVTPSSKNISGQTALVTGGANGLGQSIAIALAKEGCNVAVVDVDETNARETVAKLRRYNVSAEAYKVRGLRDKQDVSRRLAYVGWLPEWAKVALDSEEGRR